MIATYCGRSACVCLYFTAEDPNDFFRAGMNVVHFVPFCLYIVMSLVKLEIKLTQQTAKKDLVPGVLPLLLLRAPYLKALGQHLRPCQRIKADTVLFAKLWVCVGTNTCSLQRLAAFDS